LSSGIDSDGHSRAKAITSGLSEAFMQYFDVIDGRRSTRAYIPRPVPTRKLEQILSTVRSAPSAGNMQAYQIVMVEKASTKAALAEAANGQLFLCEAPVLLVFCADLQRNKSKYGERGSSLYCLQDATIAACYAATALGLASCWIGASTKRRLPLRLSSPRACARTMPIGYPAERPVQSERRPIDQIVLRRR
jgi:nitroreductase